MFLLEDIEILKTELENEYNKRGNLTHPKIIAISQALDEKIYLYHQSTGQLNN